VGDVIHTLPVLTKLRARYPRARIDWLLTPAIAELVRHHPALSNIVLFDRQGFTRFGSDWSASVGLLKLLADIRRTRYDLVIDLHGQFRSAVLTLASGARVRIGFDRPREAVKRASLERLGRQALLHGWTGAREASWLTYTHRIAIPTLDVHAIDRYLWLGAILGFDKEPPELNIPVPVAALSRIDALLERKGLHRTSLAVLVPGTVWQTKHWHVEGFAEVARYLVGTGHAVVLAGSSKERRRCQAVAAGCPAACNLAGETTLSELAAMIQRATICVTNDSGAMHLAVALGRPVVSVFGPTDPVWVGPYRRPQAVLQARIPCAPCYLRKLRSCPHDHLCMKEITPLMVIERIRRTLAEGDFYEPGSLAS
jgi:lipopolysaccharide heptosyltransferase I